jgi:hypothetical protein
MSKTNNATSDLNKGYIIGVSMLTFGLPIICSFIQILLAQETYFHLLYFANGSYFPRLASGFLLEASSK